MSDAYDRVTYHGVTLNKRTRQVVQIAEETLGYELTLVQGSYHSGVSASAGTHDGGGAMDLAPWDFANKVRVLRSLGCAAWHRLPIPGLWAEHIHVIVLGDREASSGAKAQMVDYRNGRDGLADNGPDNAPRPNPIPSFVYHEKRVFSDTPWIKDTPPPVSSTPKLDAARSAGLGLRAAKGTGRHAAGVAILKIWRTLTGKKA